jgi:hypothetical protein
LDDFPSLDISRPARSADRGIVAEIGPKAITQPEGTGKNGDNYSVGQGIVRDEWFNPIADRFVPMWEKDMKQVLLSFDPETSDQAYALLVEKGIQADFVRRGADGDVIAVPASAAPRARRLLDNLAG